MDGMEVEQLLPGVQNLPEDHIFRQIYREYKPNENENNNWDAQWADLRRPIDIDSVIARLQTPEGRAETRQWVMTATHYCRLFLHQLLDCTFEYGERGGERDPIVYVNAEAGLLAIRLALD